MIDPFTAQNKVLNASKLMSDLETYIDKILIIDMAGGRDKSTVVLQGYEYTIAQYVLNPVITLYERKWTVQDVTGNRKHTYILEFTPKGNR